jgi:hypothetical protein
LHGYIRQDTFYSGFRSCVQIIARCFDEVANVLFDDRTGDGVVTG